MSQNKFTTNNTPTLVAVSNADGETPVYLYADPITHGLVISATISIGAVTNDGTFAKESGGNLDTIAGKDFATQTTLALIKAKTDNIDVTLSTRTKPSDQQHTVVDSSALPSGAATDTKQDTGNTSLSSIDGKITAVNTGAVVVSSSVLPSGASTAAKQLPDGHNVVVTSAPTTAITAVALPLPTGASTSIKQLPDNHNVVVTSAPTTAVTGPLTDVQLRATPVPVSGTVATGGLTDIQLRATPVPVSNASLPLPAGASTAANQLIGLMPKVFDALTYTATSGTVDTYSYFTGGTGGAPVATLTVTFTASDHLTLVSAVRT